jgi:hypothetical protein
MSPSLRDALRSAADASGCSLNAYALQILASAAGDPARFRGTAVEAPDEPRDIERDERGFPLEWAARSEHGGARQEFFEAIAAEADAARAGQLVREHDRENPAFFVEWRRRMRSSDPRREEAT